MDTPTWLDRSKIPDGWEYYDDCVCGNKKQGDVLAGVNVRNLQTGGHSQRCYICTQREKDEIYGYFLAEASDRIIRTRSERIERKNKEKKK